jgi:hypothetical protein
MASRWNRYQGELSSIRHKSSTESPLSAGENSRQTPSLHSTTTTVVQPALPPALDENCARYILSVMVLFLRQTNLPETGSTCRTHSAVDASFRDFEVLDVSGVPAVADSEPSSSFQVPSTESPYGNAQRSPTSSVSLASRATVTPTVIPAFGLEYERSHSLQAKSVSSMSQAIAKFAGRVIYHLSASNWPVVYHRLQNKIHFLAQTTDEMPDTVDLQLMTYCAMDRTRLIQLLNGEVDGKVPGTVVC